MLRFLATQRPQTIHWREQHSYMLVERAEYRAVTPTHGTALLSGCVHVQMLLRTH